jgi:hypothetical protein
MAGSNAVENSDIQFLDPGGITVGWVRNLTWKLNSYNAKLDLLTIE